MGKPQLLIILREIHKLYTKRLNNDLYDAFMTYNNQIISLIQDRCEMIDKGNTNSVETKDIEDNINLLEFLIQQADETLGKNKNASSYMTYMSYRSEIVDNIPKMRNAIIMIKNTVDLSQKESTISAKSTQKKSKKRVSWASSAKETEFNPKDSPHPMPAIAIDVISVYENFRHAQKVGEEAMISSKIFEQLFQFGIKNIEKKVKEYYKENNTDLDIDTLELFKKEIADKGFKPISESSIPSQRHKF